MLSLFSFHRYSVHMHTHSRNKRGGKSLPPAAGGAIEQPTGGLGGPGGGVGEGVKREGMGSESVRVGRGSAFVMQKKTAGKKIFFFFFHLVLLLI